MDITVLHVFISKLYSTHSKCGVIQCINIHAQCNYMKHTMPTVLETLSIIFAQEKGQIYQHCICIVL